MSHLLKAMGLWMWGLIAIGISVSLVSVSYRVLSVYRSHDLPARVASSDAASPAAAAPPPLLFSPDGKPTPPSVKLIISRLIANEMTAAQKAMDEQQWSGALQNLEAAEAKSPLTPYDKAKIGESEAFAYIRLNNLKAAQAANEAVLATGALGDEELAKLFRTLFQLAAVNQQRTKAIEYGGQAYDAAALNSNDLLIMAQLYYDEHKERTTRLLNAMKSRADADKQGLPALEAEANSNPAGQFDVKLGEVYFGAGDYQGALTAISRGLGKTQINRLDEAYVYLGRGWVAQNRPTEAKKTLAQLRTLPNISPRVLRLWNLYADTLPEASSASL
jgi:tetratricopeptide (TPR) repeat protein